MNLRQPDTSSAIDRSWNQADTVFLFFWPLRVIARDESFGNSNDCEQCHSWSAILDLFSPTECANYLINSPYPARTEKRPSGEKFVNPGHQRGVVVVGRLAHAADARARDAQKRTLPPNRQRRVGAVEHRSAVRRAKLPDLLAKKSRSTVSCPILVSSCSISRSCAVSACRSTPESKACAA
jgi:hypothetical protein